MTPIAIPAPPIVSRDRMMELVTWSLHETVMVGFWMVAQFGGTAKSVVVLNPQHPNYIQRVRRCVGEKVTDFWISMMVALRLTAAYCHVFSTCFGI